MPFPYAIIQSTPQATQCIGGSDSWSYGTQIGGDAGASDPRCRPDGVYGGWRMREGAFSAWTDPLGYFPLFYAHQGDKLIISPSILQILAQGVEPRIDKTALSAFLRLGFFLDQDTPYENIHAFPPNGILRFSDSALSITGEKYISDRQEMSEDQAVDGFIERMRGSISKRPPTGDSPSLLLSGGRDSRHIALELHHQGHHNIKAYTLDRVHRGRIKDLEAATRLAKHLGYELSTGKRSKSLYKSSKHALVLTGLTTDESAWIFNAIRLVEPSASCIYDGVGGDTLFAGLRLNEENLGLARNNDLDGLTHYFLRSSRMRDQDRLKLALPSQRSWCDYDVAFERTRESVREIIDAPNPPGMFYFWHRTRRELGATSCLYYGAIPELHCPLIDRDVYDFTSSLPAELMIRGDLHTKAISRAYPEASHVPYAGGPQPIYKSLRLLTNALIDGADLMNAARIHPRGLAQAISAMTLVLQRRTSGLIPNQFLYYMLTLDTVRTSSDAAKLLDQFERTSPAKGLANPPS